MTELKLSVNKPSANQTVTFDQPFAVAGEASDLGRPEPHSIDSVTVQVDAGTPIRAILKRIPDKKLTRVSFSASVQVTGGEDPHTVTVTATNDDGLSTTMAITVFTGPVFLVEPPAVLLDIKTILSLDLTKPSVPTLVSQIQQQLTSLSASLASVGKILAGPNLAPAADAQGDPVLRMGLWIVDPGFQGLAPAAANFPLPLLSDLAATAGFNAVPVLDVPSPKNASPSFAFSVTVTTLQGLLDAVLPSLQAYASNQGITLNRISVQTSSPGAVTTSFGGDYHDIPFSFGFTENFATRPLPNAQPSQSVPALVSSSHSTSLVGSILDWVLGHFIPFADLALLVATGFASKEAGDIEMQASAVIGSMIAGIPPRVPFKDTTLCLNLTGFLPLFPTIVLNWGAFGATDSGLVGSGTTSIESRDQTMVDMQVNGQDNITGRQIDLEGAATATYEFSLNNFAPDPDKFNWLVSGAGSRKDSIQISPFDQDGDTSVFFPLPHNVLPNTYPFTLTVNGIETCGSDPTKTLSASQSMSVSVRVLRNTKVPQ